MSKSLLSVLLSFFSIQIEIHHIVKYFKEFFDATIKTAYNQKYEHNLYFTYFKFIIIIMTMLTRKFFFGKNEDKIRLLHFWLIIGVRFLLEIWL